MSTAPLFESIGIGPLSLSHRVVMAPLTRMRATIPGEAPNALNAEYYAQRATPGGLIIAEASQVVPGGKMINSTPGIHTDEQIAGWKPVVDAVHAKGGFIYLQLWHVGRLSHSSYQPDGGAPMAPSPVAATGTVKTADGQTVDKQVPREMSLQEIADLIQAYAQAAKNAKAAGFDGVEVHSANGYLLEQFRQTRSNLRTDEYGGSIDNRCRLPLEVTAAVAEVLGPERVGIRLTPFGVANDSGEDDPEPLYRYIIQQLDKMGLAYLHLIEPRASGARTSPTSAGRRHKRKSRVEMATAALRSAWRNERAVASPNSTKLIAIPAALGSTSRTLVTNCLSVSKSCSSFSG